MGCALIIVKDGKPQAMSAKEVARQIKVKKDIIP